jgi:hypothetical protein
MKLIRQIVLTVTWIELKSSNAVSLVMLPAEDGSGDDRTGVLNWAVRRAALAERPGIRLPRSVAGAAHGAASSRGSWDHPGLHRQQALALHFLARELAGAADSFRLLPRFLFRGFLVMAAEPHLAEDALALHLLLQHLEGLVDIVVTDENLHVSFLFNPAADSVSFPRRPGRRRS